MVSSLQQALLEAQNALQHSKESEKRLTADRNVSFKSLTEQNQREVQRKRLESSDGSSTLYLRKEGDTFLMENIYHPLSPTAASNGHVKQLSVLKEEALERELNMKIEFQAEAQRIVLAALANAKHGLDRLHEQ